MAAWLCTPQQEVIEDGFFALHQHHWLLPQSPTKRAQAGSDDGGDEEEDTPKQPSTNYDLNRAQEDVVDAALAMDILPRIRYLLEVDRGRQRHPAECRSSLISPLFFFSHNSLVACSSRVGGPAARRLH